VILRLLAGNAEPMVELPIMPGESSDERAIPFDPKPLTVALEARIDSLRDEVVDAVALRARLEARMKARLDGEDWAGLEEALKEYARLAPHDDYAQRLTTLKDEAAHQQAELKKAVLTKTAQAQISELQSMIDRYLDDETFKAYSDAMDRFKADSGAASKDQAKKATGGLAAAKTVTKSIAKGTPSRKAAPPASASAEAPKEPKITRPPPQPKQSGQPF
jgi:hypothetical protein